MFIVKMGNLLKGYFNNFKPVKFVLNDTLFLILLGINSELFKSNGKHCLIFNSVFLILREFIFCFSLKFSCLSFISEKLFKNNGIGEL